MPHRLTPAALPSLAPALRPRTERPRGIGVVHLGVGAFHRAHQAVFTEDAAALTGDDRWGICGVAPRSTAAVEALRPQDGLYSVLSRDADGGDLRVLGALREVLHAGTDAEALTERIAAPDTRIVSLTVTEQGYRRDPVTGGLRVADPEVAADLSGRTPRTAVGMLVRGLLARARADAGPVTVLCCDNIADNGTATARLVTEYADRLPPAQASVLQAWLPANVRFPATMVDRIVPAATDDDRTRIARQLGVADAAAVVTEPFRQWVIQDDFAAARPAWERAGALLVDDVVPYERMKLRLLNGAHSTLAYLGGLAGRQTVAEAIADPALAELVDRLMTEDVTPTLTGLAGFDLPAYRASLLRRFANPALRHRTAQIATDGSQKLPQRLLAPARQRLSAGARPHWLTLAVAAWIRNVTARRTDDGAPLTVSDPLAALIAEQVTDHTDAPATVRAVARCGVFGDDLAADPDFTDMVTTWLDRLITDGATATVHAALH
ncbi:mannitol dehydrogenase family protein [Streptomyces boninensis]|uniref:mannitol dehydrogenase family protein n=1 Tax=Streptomyces boninensis TaxID=2039455 RepID=UPI003B2102B0